MQTTNPEPRRNPWLVGLGVFLGMLGGAVLLGPRYGLMRDFLEPGDLTIYTGLGLMLAGMACGWLSSMPRDRALEWLRSAVFALLIALTIRWAVAEPYRIPSISMETTLHGDPHFLRGDRVFVNKWIYGLRWPFLNKRIWHGVAPARWDIVVFKSVEKDARHPTLVKRIVGMPGERIMIRGGKVFADGEVLPTPDFMPDNLYYTSDEMLPMKYGVRAEDEYSRVPEGHYLVLGDNSEHSRDGRYFGWLPEEHIVGRVASIWWPVDRWRDFTGFSDTLWWKTLLSLLALYVFVRLLLGQSWPVQADRSTRVEHVFVSFISYGLRLPFVGLWLLFWGVPKRGDLVLYRVKHELVPRDALLFGRIAGLPGEHAEIEGNTLKINGKPVELPWARNASLESSDAQAGYAKKKKQLDIPPGHYFLLADPPSESHVLDSRVLGWVPQRNLLGLAVCMWWPIKSMRKL